MVSGSTPPADSMKIPDVSPSCVAWAWFFIIVFFINFAMIMLTVIYFPKIQKPWFVKLWKNDDVRILYALLGLVIAYMSWLLGGAYIYGFRILHYLLGLEDPPWR